MQIYEALRNDHNKIKQLLNQLVSFTEADASSHRSKLVDSIRDELIPHARAEESIFYNSLRLIDTAKSIAMHGYKEHMEAEALLRTLQLAEKFDTKWKETARKLKESLDRHLAYEESSMFNAAQQLFTSEEAEMMCEAFQEMKPEVKEEGLMGTTIDMVSNLMPPRFSDAFKSNAMNPHPRH